MNFPCGRWGGIGALLNRLKPCAATSFAPCIVIGPGLPETMRVVGEHDAEFIRTDRTWHGAEREFLLSATKSAPK